jgi:holo-[acyl-carrier protein] synthase
MVEVTNNQFGKPEVVLHGRAKSLADNIGVKSIMVSITHDAGISAAIAVLEK